MTKSQATSASLSDATPDEPTFKVAPCAELNRQGPTNLEEGYEDAHVDEQDLNHLETSQISAGAATLTMLEGRDDGERSPEGGGTAFKSNVKRSLLDSYADAGVNLGTPAVDVLADTSQESAPRRVKPSKAIPSFDDGTSPSLQKSTAAQAHAREGEPQSAASCARPVALIPRSNTSAGRDSTSKHSAEAGAIPLRLVGRGLAVLPTESRRVSREMRTRTDKKEPAVK